VDQLGDAVDERNRRAGRTVLIVEPGARHTVVEPTTPTPSTPTNPRSNVRHRIRRRRAMELPAPTTAPANATGAPAAGSTPGAPGSAPPPEAAVLEQLLFEVKKVIVGQDRAIERMLACLIAGGHCLLESVPGLAKTLTVETLATAVGGTFSRVQFTPDLLPADVIGTRIYRASTETFDVELGPVFANFLLADEINRAPAKVQSALLEVMAEQQVTIGGVSHKVDDPFLVMATQNPIESEGVYPLPEAQRDRFLMKVVLGYPSPAEEVEIVQRMGTTPPVARQVVELEQVSALQEAAKRVYVDRSVLEYAVNLVLCTRTPENYGLPELRTFIELGASPRASIGLVRGGRALALLRGRSYLTPQDVFDVAPEVLRHRMLLSYEALAQDVDVEQVLSRILSTVPAPRVSPSQNGHTGDPYLGAQSDARPWGA
jgi:MoxR-like ATPase